MEPPPPNFPAPRPCVLMINGLPKSGKKTIALALRRMLSEWFQQPLCIVFDPPSLDATAASIHPPSERSAFCNLLRGGLLDECLMHIKGINLNTTIIITTRLNDHQGARAEDDYRAYADVARFRGAPLLFATLEPGMVVPNSHISVSELMSLRTCCCAIGSTPNTSPVGS